MKHFWIAGVGVTSLIALTNQATAKDDAANEAKLYKSDFLQCYACHSLEASETKVEPTLAGLFGRKAGSIEGFKPYSKAMTNSTIVGDEETLNEFLKNPETFLPKNTMKFGFGKEYRALSSNQHRYV